MTWQRLLIPIAIVGLLQSPVALAQFGMGAPGGARSSPRFDAAPQIGDKIADLTIVDAQGQPVNIRDLASRSPYTVLTLGCLT